MGETEYYAVNDRPVKVVELPDGSADIFVFEWATGGFVPDRSYWEHVHGGDDFKDVDRLTKDQFDHLVAPLRTRAVVKHVTNPMVWQATTDGEFPFRSSTEGYTFTIRINDFPAEPLYTLLIDGEELADLEEWPAVWNRPDSAPSAQ